MPVGDAVAPADLQPHEMDPCGRLRGGELRYQGDALPRGDEREDGREVVRVVAGPWREARCATHVQGRCVAQRSGTGEDPVRVARGQQRLGPRP